MRRWVVAGSVVVGALLLATCAHAATTRTATVTLVASQSADGYLVVPRGASLPLNVDPFMPAATPSYRGSWAVLVVRDSHGTVVAGDIWSRNMSFVQTFGGFNAIGPGTYRVSLASDGPLNVRLTESGTGSGSTLTLTRVPTMTVGVAAPGSLNGLPVDSERVATSVPSSRATVIVADQTNATAGQAEADEICLTHPGGSCLTGDSSGGGTWLSPGSSESGTGEVSTTSGIAPGAYDAVADWAWAGLATKDFLASIVLT